MSSDKKNILVIGDAHATPQSSNRRFDWLGNFIIEKRPDIIISIGDWADLSTLSSYDKGTKASWGKTYKADVNSVIDSQKRTFAPIQRYNNTMGKKKKAGYHPQTVHILGNHDDGRYNTFLSKNPEFQDHIGISDLKYDEYWDCVVPFLKIKEVSGISFCHFFYRQSQRYPLPSAKAVSAFTHRPSIWGHTHLFDTDGTSYDINGRRIQSTNVGCYLDPVDRGDTFNYTGGHGSNRWWSGLVMLKDVNQYGEYDLDTYGIESIQRDYS